MKFLIDNNLPPQWGPALSALSSVETYPVEVVALRSRFAANTRDHVWIEQLGKEGGWCILSQDRFAKGNVEKEALAQAKLVVFRLQHQWSKQAYWPKTQALMKWWPLILRQAALVQGGAMLEVPYTLRGSGRFKISR